MKPSSMIGIACLASLAGALPLTAAAQASAAATSAVTAKTSPGHATISQTHEVRASVEAIDMATREVTLKGPKGNVVTVTASPEVKNLDQVKVGDHLVVRYTEALSLTLKKDGKELRKSVAASDAKMAAAGEAPGGAVGEKVTVTADVTAINQKTHMVTLKGPKETVDLHVGDPDQLKQIKVGDQVEAEYTQALAISVQEAK
jgi:hypothetical protein